MERIDQLESQVNSLQMSLKDVTEGRIPQDILSGKAQSLKDREIIEFIGEE